MKWFLLSLLLFTLAACSRTAADKEFSMTPEATSGQFIWPASGWISATDHYWTGKPHTLGSADIAAPYWLPVSAARPGTVSEAGWSVSPRLGNFVKIDHGNGYETLYAHLVELPLVKAGEVVRTNQRLGFNGRTGNAGNAHVHFTILRNGEAQVIPEINFGTWVNKGALIPGDFPGLSHIPQSTPRFSVKVIADRLPVYSSASAGSSVRGTLAVDTTWTVTGGSAGFYQITYNSIPGYITSSGVVPSGSKIFGIRTTSAASAHSGPGNSYLLMTTIPSGTVLSAFETKNGFYKTQWKDANSFVYYVWIPISTATITSLFWMRATLAPKAQLRSGPGMSYPVVQTKTFNAYKPEYLVVDNVAGWYKVGANLWFPGWQTLRR